MGKMVTKKAGNVAWKRLGKGGDKKGREIWLESVMRKAMKKGWKSGVKTSWESCCQKRAGNMASSWGKVVTKKAGKITIAYDRFGFRFARVWLRTDSSVCELPRPK